jgi:hypothetical protein
MRLSLQSSGRDCNPSPQDRIICNWGSRSNETRNEKVFLTYGVPYHRGIRAIHAKTHHSMSLPHQ